MVGQKDYQGATSARESATPYSRAYYAKLDELTALNRHPDDAAHEARCYASDQAQEEISSEEAAALVAALGISYRAIANSITGESPLTTGVDVDGTAAPAIRPIEPAPPTLGSFRASPRDQSSVPPPGSWDNVVAEANGQPTSIRRSAPETSPTWDEKAGGAAPSEPPAAQRTKDDGWSDVVAVLNAAD